MKNFIIDSPYVLITNEGYCFQNIILNENKVIVCTMDNSKAGFRICSCTIQTL
jgi:hypothetical protein